MARLYGSWSRLPPSSGDASNFGIEWNSFVEYVLDVTVQAYEKMRAETQLDKSWEEEQFSAILAEEYLIPVAGAQSLPLKIDTEVRIVTDDMKTGKKPIRTARKIDIRVTGSWQKQDYNKIYFAWECKNIADRRTNKNLITDYVSEGIFRFCDSVYSADVANAGMIGFVIDGDIGEIVSGINDSMTSLRRDRRVPDTEKLSISKPRFSLNDIYESNHHRHHSNSDIHLHHLFLTFDWLPESTIGSNQDAV